MVLLGAWITIWLTFIRVRSQRKQFTIEFISRHEIHNKNWVNPINTIVNAHLLIAGGLLEKSYAEWMEDEIKTIDESITIINHYEMIAIAIKEGSLDESIYSDWIRPHYVHLFKASWGYIDNYRSRRGMSEFAIEFQQLAEKWDDENELADLPSSGER